MWQHPRGQTRGNGKNMRISANRKIFQICWMPGQKYQKYMILISCVKQTVVTCYRVGWLVSPCRLAYWFLTRNQNHHFWYFWPGLQYGIHTVNSPVSLWTPIKLWVYYEHTIRSKKFIISAFFTNECEVMQNVTFWILF